jgi:restriction endonuclease S subunit
VLSADEKRLMTHIIEELALDLDHLPEQARIALRDD